MQKTKYKDAGLVSHSRIDICVGYECPECSLDHFLSPAQYLYEGYIIVCDCGTTFKPKNPGIGIIDTKEKSNKKYTKSNKDELSLAIDILLSQGFSQLEINNVIKNNDISGNVEEIISSILQRL